MILVSVNFEHDSRLRVKSSLIKKLQFNSLRRGRPFHLDLEVYMPFVATQMGKSAA